MSHHDKEATDQTENIFQELLAAERCQEITQTATLQGQIVALVLILRDAGALSKAQVNDWEAKSEKVASLIFRMARANETRSSQNDEDPMNQLETMLEGLDATIEFARMMENSDETLTHLRQQRDDLAKALESMKNDTQTDQSD
jgi:hypothetical protein